MPGSRPVNLRRRVSLQLIGVAFMACAWRRQTDLGDLVHIGWFVTLLIVGAVALCCSGLGLLTLPSRRSAYMATLGGIFLLSVPAESVMVGAATVVAACGIAMIAGGRLRGACAALIAGVAATMLVGDALSYLALTDLSAERAAEFAAAGMRLLATDARSGGNVVYIETLRSVQGFQVTASALGLQCSLGFAVVSFLLHWAGEERVFPKATLAYGLLRCLAVAVCLRWIVYVGVCVTLEAGSEYTSLEFPYAPRLNWAVGLAMDCFACLTAIALTVPHSCECSSPTARPSWSTRQVAAVALMAGIAGVSAHANRIMDHLGTEKAGRIAFDEYHSKWEASDTTIGRETYGAESGYNFRGIADWLSTTYGPIRRIYEPLADALLEKIDVLILKTPTEALDAPEVQALQRFVDRGGGVLLIGDHTNVYGTSEVLNAAAAAFGIRFRYDCLFDHRSRFEFNYQRDVLLRSHPILRDTAHLLFEVGCSIAPASWRCRPVVVGRGLKSQPIDYSIENFYPQPHDLCELSTGEFAALVVRHWGRGRVVAIGDSTLFSTFSVFMPGRREIFEGMVRYANSRDVGEGWRIALECAACALLVLCFWVLRGRGIFLLGAMTMIGWGSGQLMTAVVEAAATRVPRDTMSRTELNFVSSDSSVEWPEYGFPDRQEDCYSLFFQYSNRAGIFPRLVETTDLAIDRGGPFVLIDPVAKDAGALAQKLVRFVGEGGTLILMESSENAILSRIAAECELGLERNPESDVCRSLRSVYGDLAFRGTRRPSRWIRGGWPLLTVEMGAGAEPVQRPVGVVTNYGKGRLVLMTCAHIFSNMEYGIRYNTIPDVELRRLYEVQFQMTSAAVNTPPRRE